MIGLSTYAFFWQISDRAPEPLRLENMLLRTRELGGEVFQICDYLPLQNYSDVQLQDVKKHADNFGITLELGTKGIKPDHLSSYLRMAQILGVKLVRSMVNTPEHRPTLIEAGELLKQSMPAYEAAGVTIALETYEQLSSTNLVNLIKSVNSPCLGICLDPANCVAALENPIDVIDRCAPYVANLHVKDFAFTRRGGWIGFTLEGAELGTGLLDYDYLIRKVAPESRGINRILEHWLPWQGEFEESRRMENLWNVNNLAYMRSHAA